LAEHNVERALRFHEPYAADYRVVWPEGEVRWLHCRGRAVAANDGTVVRLIGTSQDITERKQLEARLAHQALHDTLTGLPNRVLLLDRLAHAMQRNSRSKHHTAVLFVDLIGSRRSTTAPATTPATRSCGSSRAAWLRVSVNTTPWPVTAATSSWW
jgi:hypothetical protein